MNILRCNACRAEMPQTGSGAVLVVAFPVDEFSPHTAMDWVTWSNHLCQGCYAKVRAEFGLKTRLEERGK